LIIDRDLRHGIDFYLSAIGELSLREIKQLMAEKMSYQQNNFDEREQLRLETALRLLADD
jgi:hypothetical protein